MGETGETSETSENTVVEQIEFLTGLTGLTGLADRTRCPTEWLTVTRNTDSTLYRLTTSNA
jgi:hypothetical protein